MENASKALIIAAAVLIAILLISSAIFLVTSGSESVNSSGATMTELQIQSFNNKFTTFEGKRKSSAEVMSLLKTVASSNSLNDNQIVIKLTGKNLKVLDSSSYMVYNDSNERFKNNSSNIVSLDEIMDKINENIGYTYTVKCYNCNQKTQSLGNNKHLKPAIGCVFLILIERNAT